MARTIMTLDKSYIDLIISGNAFGLSVNQIDGDNIKVTGMLENGATLIIDGIETINTQRVPKEELPTVNKVENLLTVVETPEIHTPIEEEKEEPIIDEEPTKEEPEQKEVPVKEPVNAESQNKRTRIIVKTRLNEILEDLASGMVQTTIAEKYGISAGTVSRLFRNNKSDVQKMKRRKVEEHLNDIITELSKGTSVYDVAAKFKIPEATIQEVYAANLNKVKSTRSSIISTPVVRNTFTNTSTTPTPSAKDDEEPRERTIVYGNEDEDIPVDSETEASIISHLIDDVPIIKIAKDFNLPKGRVQKIYFDNKPYICKARESRIRRPRIPNNGASFASNAVDDNPSEESLRDLVKNFANR